MDPIEAAKLLIAQHYNRGLLDQPHDGELMIYTHDVKVVWFCYILGGWKCLLIVGHKVGYEGAKYYEVTYNTKSGETYIDMYMKLSNMTIKDAPLDADEDVSPEPVSIHPQLRDANLSNFISIGDQCFSDGRGNVISWRGENFYRACGYPVMTHSDGSGSSCVKRANHPGKKHEDYDGVVVKENASNKRR